MKVQKKQRNLQTMLICLQIELKLLLLTRLLDALFGGLPRRLLAGLKINVGGSSGNK